MSDLDDMPSEQKKILNKLNKTLKEYSNKLDKINNKFAKLMEQPVNKNNDAEREKMDKIFKKK